MWKHAWIVCLYYLSRKTPWSHSWRDLKWLNQNLLPWWRKCYRKILKISNINHKVTDTSLNIIPHFKVAPHTINKIRTDQAYHHKTLMLMEQTPIITKSLSLLLNPLPHNTITVIPQAIDIPQAHTCTTNMTLGMLIIVAVRPMNQFP